MRIVLEPEERVVLSRLLAGCCPICGWPFRERKALGCVPGACSYDGPVAFRQRAQRLGEILKRLRALVEVKQAA